MEAEEQRPTRRRRREEVETSPAVGMEEEEQPGAEQLLLEGATQEEMSGTPRFLPEAVLEALPADVRERLSLDRARVLAESQVNLRLAEVTADAERLRADLARTDAERRRLRTQMNALERQLAESEFGNVENDPRYRAYMALRGGALALTEAQIRETTTYQRLEAEVVDLRRALADAIERAVRAEAQVVETERRFLNQVSDLQQALGAVAITTAGTAVADAMSATGWYTMGLLALVDLRQQAGVSTADTPQPYYAAAAQPTFDRFTDEAARGAAAVIQGQAAPVASIVEQGNDRIAQLADERDALPADDPLRVEYDRAIGFIRDTVATRGAELDTLERAADPGRLAGDYAITMRAAYAFLRAASLLDDAATVDAIATILPVQLMASPDSARYLLNAAIWYDQGQQGDFIQVPLNAANVIQAWTAARVMRALWWPLARAIADPDTTSEALAALWVALAGLDQPYPSPGADFTTPAGRDEFYDRLEAEFIAAFEEPTPDSLARAWNAGHPGQPVAGLAALICGIVSTGSARLLRVPRDLVLACEDAARATGSVEAVLAQATSLFGFGLPPWNSAEVPVARALLRPETGAGAMQTATKTPFS
ncbi:SMC N incomplete domain containing protein [Pandoravirus neocaledonia]|uniref:SMC N incomplete domain containing protein n=1 Tax=Pandoravirus neocaledonia TaxID=2107708 RepID=A0A2U7UC47_9VIRU|nr:SMC N incomplete domain containing protein [Pandoravirus neocaledonia]AVK75925.1 SMC N incomplete domain containing protein [Pandoravirus neocaledonia]